MAASSLSYMQVPGADGGGGQTLLMPKLQYRFRVIFSGFGVSGNDQLQLTKQIIDCTRPSVEFTEIPIEIYNSRVYLAGKPTWQALTINVRDDATGSVSKVVGEQLQKQFDFTEQASAAAGNNYKFQVNIQILDGNNGAESPGVLETWECYGCYVGTANYNNLNYGTNEPATITLNIRFDNAVQTSGIGGDANGVGVLIGQRAGQVLGTSITGVGASN